MFTLKVHRERHDAFRAEVAELPGCFTSGKSLEEVRGQARIAVELFLESLEEEPTAAASSPPKSPPGPVEFELVAE